MLLNESIIKSLTTERLYVEGFALYKRGSVSDIITDFNNMTFKSNVLEIRKYTVIIKFTDTGDYKSSKCDCPMHKSTLRVCRHIIAVLSKLNVMINTGNLQIPKQTVAPLSFFDYLQESPSASKHTPIYLEKNIYLVKRVIPNTNKSTYKATMALKIGIDKFYIVKDIRAFLDAFLFKHSVRFGKFLIYDPLEHYFNTFDLVLIDLLLEIYDVDAQANKSYILNKTKDFFDGRLIFLTNAWLTKFLDLAKEHNEPFHLYVGADKAQNTIISQENISTSLYIEKSKENLTLKVNVPEKFKILTQNRNYALVNNQIYSLENKDTQKALPFIEAAVDLDRTTFSFPPKYRDRFLTEVMPYANNTGLLELDEDIKNMIIRLPLLINILLDKTEKNIIIDVKFIYGDYQINPFAPIGQNGIPRDVLLLRDKTREDKVLEILEGTDSIVGNKALLLALDNKAVVFDFITEIVPALQKNSEVFYSDSFSKIKVRSKLNLSGKISMNGGYLDFEFSAPDLSNEELNDILISLKSKNKFHLLEDGSFINLSTDNIDALYSFSELLESEDIVYNDGIYKLPASRAFLLDRIRNKPIFSHLERDITYKNLLRGVGNPEDSDIPVPDNLKSILRDYQKTGFRWLASLSKYGLGGILADDMGLGKTLQTLALILERKNENTQNISIIVSPSAIIYNWLAEIKKFTPSLRACVISGSAIIRKKHIENYKDYDILITSYPCIRNDIHLYKNINFDLCFIDEAQNIKNPTAVSTFAVKELHSKNRFALSGTPMENNLMEMWSIFDFVMPGFLYDMKTFKSMFHIPISTGSELQAKVLSAYVKPFIMRRLKKDVLNELPEKFEYKLVSELTDMQKKTYIAYLDEAKKELASEISDKGFNKSKMKILAIMTRLRQICCHPSLFIDDYKGESGKFLMLQEIVKEALEGKHRILIFSQFAKMLAIIKTYFEEEKISYFYLDGSTKPIHRLNMVNRYNEGEKEIFLISLKAGGTGLNLTGADMVIHYDPWWNPAVEDQASDRAYRIGQLKNVQVIKLITAGTIEEKIYNLQQEKKNLIEKIITPGETFLSSLSNEDMDSIFNISF